VSTGPRFLGEQELPWDEGTHRGPDVYDPHVEYGPGRWTLTGLSKEFVLYSADLFRVTGLPFDPVALYWEEAALPPAEAPIELTLERPVLAGLPVPFDHTLYACPVPYAAGLLRHLDRMSVRMDGVVWASVRQMIPVVDWPLLGRTAVAPVRPPRVPVALYGMTTDRMAVYWRPPSDPWTGAVTLVRRALEPKGAKR
jgi:hypothetical protein